MIYQGINIRLTRENLLELDKIIKKDSLEGVGTVIFQRQKKLTK